MFYAFMFLTPLRHVWSTPLREYSWHLESERELTELRVQKAKDFPERELRSPLLLTTT